MRRLALLAVLAAGAAAPPPGASSCTGCHAGGSAMGALAGLPAPTIEAEMAEYRTGQRPATLMDRIAKGFTPAQTAAIAAWFAAQ